MNPVLKQCEDCGNLYRTSTMLKHFCNKCIRKRRLVSRQRKIKKLKELANDSSRGK